MSANEYEFKFVNKKAALQLIEDKVIKIADLQKLVPIRVDQGSHTATEIICRG